MPYFVKCSVPSILWYTRVFNNPVNISLCTSLAKFEECYYLVNIGKPAIKFEGCNTQWVFDKVEDRDAEFEKLSLIQTPN